VKLAAPDRDVFVLVGDGSYLMMNSEIATSVQERQPLVIVVVDDHGFASIGGLSRALGLDGFGTRYRARSDGSIGLDSEKDAAPLAIDLVAHARSLGANAVRSRTVSDLRAALAGARRADRTSVIVVEADRYAAVPSYGSWWEVAVSEVSEEQGVRDAREAYEKARKAQRWHI
jgi:3D-(3,5/4)-trihydroxycyclohexane-1,2-dione acylhydrolase (decyclizing)